MRGSQVRVLPEVPDTCGGVAVVANKPHKLGVGGSSLAGSAEMNKGFDNMPCAGYVKAFFLCVFK